MSLLVHLAAAAACASGFPGSLAVPPASQQLVTVQAARASAATGALRLWTRVDGCWTPVAGPWPARLGRRGVSAHRREGDGTTPLGVYGFGDILYGLAPNPGVRYRYHRLVCGDWWDEDPASPTYNTFRHVRCGTQPPFGGDSEALWRSTRAYRLFAVIRYNVAPVVPGRGSAIFVHVDTGRATNGCVSLPLPQLVRVLRWLRPSASPSIAIALR